MSAVAKKRISILGSTGSVGMNTLRVCHEHPDRFEVVGLTTNSSVSLLLEQMLNHHPKIVAVMNESHLSQVKESSSSINVKVSAGIEGLIEVATFPEADIVVSAISGASGFLPTLSAIRAGKQIAIANKEPLVMAGGILMDEAKRKNVRILPVDSEHSAIFQCLNNTPVSHVKRLILTASGGPFYSTRSSELSSVTPKQALTHPVWEMGQKVTIDSATLMNKGLEVIEAMWLFGIDSSKIDVIIHPEGVIHSLVEFVDGATLAQLGIPDMRIPIQYALTYPERVKNSLASLDLLTKDTLTFKKPDFEKFPCLELAYEAARKGGTMPAVLSSANEVAVRLFLTEKIRFPDISEIVAKVMRNHTPIPCPEVEDILKVNSWAEKEAEECFFSK